MKRNFGMVERDDSHWDVIGSGPAHRRLFVVRGSEGPRCVTVQDQRPGACPNLEHFSTVLAAMVFIVDRLMAPY